MDQIPPVRKAKGVNLDSILPPLAKAITSRITKTTANTLATELYWCFRYALAPSRMEDAIFTILSFPSEKDMTLLRWTSAKISANAAPTKPIQNRLSIDFSNSF